jgi:hypothetical protein
MTAVATKRESSVSEKVGHPDRLALREQLRKDAAVLDGSRESKVAVVTQTTVADVRARRGA